MQNKRTKIALKWFIEYDFLVTNSTTQVLT